MHSCASAIYAALVSPSALFKELASGKLLRGALHFNGLAIQRAGDGYQVFLLRSSVPAVVNSSHTLPLDSQRLSEGLLTHVYYLAQIGVGRPRQPEGDCGVLLLLT